MRSRLLGATVATGVLVLVLAAVSACGGDDAEEQSQATLPPIVTAPTTAPTTAAPSTTLPQYYEVQRGDTLFQIADSYRLPMQAIMDLNGIEDPNDIQAGQILELPSTDIVANALPTTVATSAAATTTTTAAP